MFRCRSQWVELILLLFYEFLELKIYIVIWNLYPSNNAEQIFEKGKQRSRTIKD